MTIKNLDSWITGENDPNAPFNQMDNDLNENQEYETIEGAIDGEDDERALEILDEVMRQVNFLRDYAKSNENIFLLKRLNSIYNKL